MNNYFLHAELNLNQPSQAAAFKGAMKAFIGAGGFAGAGLPAPLAPLKQAFLFEVIPTAKMRGPIGQIGSGPPPDFVHLWIVPNNASLDLATAMQCLPNNKAYMAVDTLVSLEQQEWVFLQTSVESQLEGSLALTSSERYIRTVHQCDTQSQSVNWIINSVGTLARYLRPKGWVCVGTLWTVTGRVRTVTDFWQVPPDSTEDTVSQNAMLALAQQSGASAAFLQQCSQAPETSRLLLQPYEPPCARGQRCKTT
jgi:hypothetical protein